MDDSAVDLKSAGGWKAPDLYKPHPALPRESVIERSTSIKVIRGPRSG